MRRETSPNLQSRLNEHSNVVPYTRKYGFQQKQKIFVFYNFLFFAINLGAKKNEIWLNCCIFFSIFLIFTDNCWIFLKKKPFLWGFYEKFQENWLHFRIYFKRIFFYCNLDKLVSIHIAEILFAFFIFLFAKNNIFFCFFANN